MGVSTTRPQGGLTSVSPTTACGPSCREGRRSAANKLAYDSWTSPPADGVERDLTWAQFSIRTVPSAHGCSRSQARRPSAILCSRQNPSNGRVFFALCIPAGLTVPLFDHERGRAPPTSAGCTPRAQTTAIVGHHCHHRGAAERGYASSCSRPPRNVRALSKWSGARRGRRELFGEHVDLSTETIAYLQYTSGSTRIQRVYRYPPQIW